MGSRNPDPLIARDAPPVATLPDRACAAPDIDPEIFFPGAGARAAEARAVCGLCPHRQPCLDWALATRQGYGIWGGTSPDERDRMTREDTP